MVSVSVSTSLSPDLLTITLQFPPLLDLLLSSVSSDEFDLFLRLDKVAGKLFAFCKAGKGGMVVELEEEEITGTLLSVTLTPTPGEEVVVVEVS